MNVIRLLVGTQNPGKQAEYRDLLADLPVIWVGPEEVGLADFSPAEDGDSFEVNARLKAVAFARRANLPALADDSGLEVDALAGAPGVYSARYGGPGATDVDRYRRVLEELDGVPAAARAARFVCVVALALPDGRVYTARGTVEGAIGDAPRGAHGFGYDPIFVLPDGRHMAELSPAEKHALSHRGTALARFKPTLLKVFAELDPD